MSVRDHDERWDELALGHVLGGLPTAEAASFRTHLASCDLCRTRVAELRSLDSEMAAAEREERAAQREQAAARTPTRTDAPAPRQREVPRRSPDDGPRWRTIVLTALTALLLAGLSLWNAHLRAQNAYLAEVAEVQDETLEALGQGTVVPLTTSGDVTGVVSVDGDRIAYTLSGLPDLEVDERLVVWIEDDRGPRSVDVVRPAASGSRRLSSTVSAVDAQGMLVTVEPASVPAAPTGPVVVEADLSEDVDGPDGTVRAG